MVADTHNDKETASGGVLSSACGAHGEAALLLVESLIHMLIERETITVAEAIEIVETALEAKSDTDPKSSPKSEAVVLLEAIAVSLSHDL